MAGLFQASEHRGDYHDCQADPEQDEKAAKVSILALGVKMRDTSCVFDGREESLPLPRSHLSAGLRGRLN